MQGTEYFKETIRSYLVKRAQTDPLFSKCYTNPLKNIDDCITYILNEVQMSKCNGFTDEEIFSLAIHYYVEENVKPGNLVNCRIIVNHYIEPTEEEIKAARENAIKRLEEENYAALKKKQERRQKGNTGNVQQLSLF